MKIVIPDPIWGIPEKYWDELRELGAEIYADKPRSQDEAVARVKDAEIVVLNYVDGDKRLIDAVPNLKYIISPAVGYDWIDTQYAADQGIPVLNCPTFVPQAVAEQALALLFSLAKRLPEARDDLQAGLWKSNKYTSVELTGKKLGLVGYGNIGHHLERMATGIGMQVRYTNSKSSDEEIDVLIADSDVVCLCLPLNDKTKHLIDTRRLRLFKPSAFLINVARGPIVDQTALLESLVDGKLAGAGLDVFEGEPPAEGEISEQIRQLVNMPNVVATPHSSFNTPETLDRKGREIVANVRSCLAGKPTNVINQ